MSVCETKIKSAEAICLRSIICTQKDWDIIQEELDHLQDWRTGNGVKFV